MSGPDTAMSYLELLRLAAPETIVVLTALAVLAADLLALQELEARFRRLIGGMIACAGCAAAIAWMVVLPQHANFLQGMLVIDPMIRLIKVTLLILTIFTIVLSVDADFTSHAGEYFALLLLATVGMMFLVSTEDTLMIFISLELTSLSLYILTAFHKSSAPSAEAALKYFLFGGLAAACTLFGLSLLYGIAGSTHLEVIARNIAEKTAQLPGSGIAQPMLDPLLAAAIVLTLIGFGFKVAAAPFHLWAPDTYQGAPVPSAAFIASGSKVAGFFVFAKVVLIGFAGAASGPPGPSSFQGWMPALALMAAISMVLGNLAAIVQSSVRRLLAYSAVAHAGYMLLGIMAGGSQSLASLVYYVITYSLTTLGAFGVVAVVQQRTGAEGLPSFAGLSRRAPLLSFCMLVFLLSLAGIPPLAGFFGKFYVFAAALGAGPAKLSLLWLVILALAMSAVSLFYYLQVLKQIYVVDPPAAGPMQTPVLSLVAISLLALAVLVLGCAPSLLLSPLSTALHPPSL